MSLILRLIALSWIVILSSGLHAVTTVLIVTGSGEFESKVPKVWVATAPLGNAFQLFWSTTEKGAASLSWEVRTGQPPIVVLSGKETVKAGVTSGFFYVSSAFLSAQPPTSPESYEIFVTPLDAQQKPLGSPSAAVTVVQQKETPSPPTQFGRNALFPKIQFMQFQAHVNQVPQTDLRSVTATIRVRLTNPGNDPTDPMLFSIIDRNHLVVAKAAAPINAIPPLKLQTKPVEQTVTLELAPLLPPATNAFESSRYDAWEGLLHSRGVDIAGVLDWRGPVQNSPMSTHLDVPLYQGKTDSCEDGKLDGDEALVDCGGSCSAGNANALNLCSNHTDINGLLLNPIWDWQITRPGQVPDFQATCGANPGNCTNWSVLFDVVSKWPFCGADPFSGHANWGIATFDGKVRWGEYDRPPLGDDDYNMNLDRLDNAALTTDNWGLGLEFKADETVNGFASPWWIAFVGAVSPSPARPQGLPTPQQMLDGNYAIVTGLIGIDGVHGGKTESHPVYSFALQTGQTDSADEREESWSLFIRNWGNEGFCSQQQHYWDSASGDYWLQLPWPEGASDVATDLGKTSLFGSQAGLEPPALWKGPNPDWLFIHFSLPVPAQMAVVHGDLTLRYTFPKGKMHNPRQAAPQNTIRPHIDIEKANKLSGASQVGEEDFQAHLAQIKDPQMRAQFEQVLKQWQAAQPTRIYSHVPLPVNPTVRGLNPLQAATRTPGSGRERVVVDEQQVKRNEDLQKRLESQFGKQLP